MESKLNTKQAEEENDKHLSGNKLENSKQQRKLMESKVSALTRSEYFNVDKINKPSAGFCHITHITSQELSR